MSEQKKLDRPELREKIESYDAKPCSECNPHCDSTTFKLFCPYQTSVILALILDIEELDKIRIKIAELNKRLDDREEALIEAKKQEGGRIIKILEDALEEDFVMTYADEDNPSEPTISPQGIIEIIEALREEK